MTMTNLRLVSVEDTTSDTIDAPELGPRLVAPRRASLRRPVALAVLWFAVVGGVLLVRSWGGGTATSSASPATAGSSAVPTMPVSAEIEATYGIRFTLVAVTAGGGMIELRYQVLDSDKTAAVHDAAPLVIDANGARYADPGMVGHSHVSKAKVAGTTDYILLANASGGVQPGTRVTIRVGTLELRNVPVL
jgi:hypothetical protein